MKFPKVPFPKLSFIRLPSLMRPGVPTSTDGPDASARLSSR